MLAAEIRAARHHLESLQRLPALDLPYIPQTEFALSPSAVRTVLNDLVLHDRRCVVEFGAGVSTLYISKLLAERALAGSMLVTIEHDAGWLGLVAEMLQRLCTTAVVQLVHAPLEPAAPGQAAWYGRSVVDRALAGQLVDAALVDGPRSRNNNDPETRHPALPALAPHLNPAGAVVFLDDVNRPGERRIYERWARDLGMERVSDAEFCGLGILVPPDRPLKYRIV